MMQWSQDGKWFNHYPGKIFILPSLGFSSHFFGLTPLGHNLPSIESLPPNIVCNFFNKAVVSLRSRSISLNHRCLPQCEKCGQLVLNIRLLPASSGPPPKSLPSTVSPEHIKSNSSSYSFIPRGRSLIASKVIDFKVSRSAKGFNPPHIHSSSSRSRSSRVISTCSIRRTSSTSKSPANLVNSCVGSRRRRPLCSQIISYNFPIKTIVILDF